MKRFDPVIKWSGSKRSQAEKIISYMPQDIGCYYEPFVGGGSILYALQPQKGVCGDICEPLIGIWNQIKESPEDLAEAYRVRWTRLQEEGYTAFYDIRDDFNRDQNPADLLFLSRTCVNGLIRFNTKGEFNNALHHTRPGIAPDRLKKIIYDWSEKISNVTFLAKDYRETTAPAKKGDLIYLDPPYFHTRGRYYGTIDFEPFIEYLDDLNRREIKFILSFDGVRGDSDYTVSLPNDLYKRHEMIPSGNSSFKKVMDKEMQQVYESLYLNW